MDIHGCNSTGDSLGWVRLKSVDRKEFVYMVPPPIIPGSSIIRKKEVENTGSPNVQPTTGIESVPEINLQVSLINNKSTGTGSDATELYWTVLVDSVHDSTKDVTDHPEISEDNVSLQDVRYHFLLEKEGYILSRAVMGYLNTFASNHYAVRGHGSTFLRDNGKGVGYKDIYMPSRREYTAHVAYEWASNEKIQESLKEQIEQEKEVAQLDQKYIKKIALLPSSALGNSTGAGFRVISFGLYGSKMKYMLGAIRNAELALVYFPGWKCRYYATSDVPVGILNVLKKFNHVEIVPIPDGEGYVAGE